MQSGYRTVAGLSPTRRSALLLGALAVGSLLILAGRLTPDPRGLGTHQQLGFPPCTIREVLEMRCPACGMTTSWSHFVRGEWWPALQASVAGTILAATALVAVPWGIATAVRGTWVGFEPKDTALLVGCLSVLTVALSEWMIRLMMERLSGS